MSTKQTPLRRRVFVTTVPFGTIDDTPLRRLAEANVELVINPLGRRLKAEEIPALAQDFPVIIAGTEVYSTAALAACSSLRAICRVGIGLDGVPLGYCKQNDIAVSYTPDAPSPAVAELTVGLLLSLLRGAVEAHQGLRRGAWNRITGRRVADSTIGIVGIGRIGGRVARHLLDGFPGVRILCHDPVLNPALTDVTWVGMDQLLRESDAVSLHVPLMDQTRHMLGWRELQKMKPDAVLINTARGGIVSETDLARALRDKVIRAAAIDVFEEEPYTGPLAELENAILTCHMGSMTADCRVRMEIEATEEAIRFLNGEPFVTPVPASEYALAEAAA